MSKANENKVKPKTAQDAELASAVAGVIVSGAMNAARVVVAYNPSYTIDFVAARDVLVEHQREVKAGDMSRAENMLINQAAALQSMFVDLAIRAKNQTGLAQLQTLTGLALKAQASCRATLQTLGELKYPRQPTFVKQANIAHGPQQVNNEPAAPSIAHAGKNQTQPNEVLAVEDQRNGSTHLDTGATQAAGREHQTVETVAAGHRPQKRRR